MSPIARLCKTIYTVTGKKISPADLQVESIGVNTNLDVARNTQALLIARENGRLKGGMTFYYNRLDLSTLFSGAKVVLTLPFGSRITTQSLAKLVGERFGLDLLPEDVLPSGEYYLSSFPFELKLVADPQSLAVVNELTVEIKDAGLETSIAVGIPTLDGLNAPSGRLDRIQAVLYSWHWQPDPAMVAMLKTKYVGDLVDSDILPFLPQVTTDTWVNEETPSAFNVNGASVTYRGNRDDHPSYSLEARHDEIIVITLTDKCDNMAGDWVISLS